MKLYVPLLSLLLKISQQCRLGKRENTISLKTATPHNQPTEGRQKENSTRQNELTD